MKKSEFLALSEPPENIPISDIYPNPPIIKKRYMGINYAKGEINNEPSQTIPDEAMTIKEIMNRFTRGLPLGGSNEPVYDGDEDFVPDFSRMDLAERQEWTEAHKEELEALKLKQRTAKKKVPRETELEGASGDSPLTPTT